MATEPKAPPYLETYDRPRQPTPDLYPAPGATPSEPIKPPGERCPPTPDMPGWSKLKP